MRIILDCDCVLSDFVGAALDTVESLGFRRPARHETTQFQLADNDWFQRCAALNLSFPGRFWRALCAPGVARDMRPLPQLYELISLLLALEADVTVVTAPMKRSATWREDRAAWLAHNFPVPHALVFDARKERYSADLFVDDSEDNCRRWQSAHPRGQAILWRTHHTRESPGFPSCGSALELAAYLCEVASPVTKERAFDWAQGSTRKVRAVQEWRGAVE